MYWTHPIWSLKATTNSQRRIMLIYNYFQLNFGWERDRRACYARLIPANRTGQFHAHNSRYLGRGQADPRKGSFRKYHELDNLARNAISYHGLQTQSPGFSMKVKKKPFPSSIIDWIFIQIPWWLRISSSTQGFRGFNRVESFLALTWQRPETHCYKSCGGNEDHSPPNF